MGGCEGKALKATRVQTLSGPGVMEWRTGPKASTWARRGRSPRLMCEGEAFAIDACGGVSRAR